MLDQLLARERDQHAEYDDADFLEELAPTLDGMLGDVDFPGQK